MQLDKLSVVFRRERSLHGINPRVLKSALQKYARRGQWEKGVWCLVEMDLFSLGLSDLETLARNNGVTSVSARRRIDSLRTNLINRLVVMVSEEVNVHSVWLPVVARELYQTWWNTRDSEASRRELVNFYLLLVEAEKSRIVSDYKTVFNLAPYYLKEDRHSELVEMHRAFLKENAPDLYEINYGSSWSGYTESDFVGRVMSCARRGEDTALFWCGRAIELFGARAATRIWNALEADGFAKESVKALRFFYNEMTHQEKPIYLYHALLLMVFRDKLESGCGIVRTPKRSVDVQALYALHCKNPALNLDEFVFDLHTGSRDAHGRTTFATEGARIEGESLRVMNPKYRELYVAFKEKLDERLEGRRA